MKKVASFALVLVTLLTLTATVWAQDPSGDVAVIQAAADAYLSSDIAPVISADALFENLNDGDTSNDPFIVSQNDNLVAINSAIEVDLTGQAVADSIGERLYSGIGGHADFMRGAAMARGASLETTEMTPSAPSSIVGSASESSPESSSRGFRPSGAPSSPDRIVRKKKSSAERRTTSPAPIGSHGPHSMDDDVMGESPWSRTAR